jgi:hypothetical protein
LRPSAAQGMHHFEGRPVSRYLLASNQTLAEIWNGTHWSIQGTPNPSGATFSAFFGLSCRSTTCMGVGWSRNGSGVDTTVSEFRE